MSPTGVWIRRIFIPIAALVPMAIVALLIVRYSVNVPFYDDWGQTDAFKGWSHPPSGSFLFSQLNEHRPVMTRLILWITTSLSGGDFRSSTVVMFILAISSSALALILLKLTTSMGRPWYGWWLAIHFLIFSPVQHENWLWGINVHFSLTIVCLLAGLVLIELFPVSWYLIFIGMVLSLVAAFSMTQGLLLSVLFPLAVLGHRPLPQHNKGIFWGVYLTLLFAAFFFTWNSQNPNSLWCLHHLEKSALYLLVFLGSGFSRGYSKLIPMFIGLLLSIAWFSEIVIVLMHRRNLDLIRRSVPWMVVGLFAMGSAAMATWGRAAMGVLQAESSRYTTISQQLCIAVIALCPVIFSTPKLRRVMRPARLPALVVAGTLFSSWMITQVQSVTEMRLEAMARMRGKAGVELLNYPNSNVILAGLFPDPEYVRAKAIELNRLDRLHPGILPGGAFSSIISNEAGQGWFRTVAQSPDGSVAVSGVAQLPSGRQADCVLITCDGRAKDSSVIWMISVPIGRADITRVVGPDASPGSWKTVVPPPSMREDYSQLSAWAFDATTRTAYQLKKA